MSTLGTFDSFSTARLGIYAAQQGLQVTGNNISNINTAGYTRQRLDQVSFKAGAYDRYRSQLDNHSGTGALVMNINQIRDPYLDVRYRNITADVGYNDTKLAGLNRIASILDEVGVGDDTNVNKKGDGRLQAQIQAVSDALRKFSKEPTKLNNDLVRKAADTLCGILNSYATQLESFRKETEETFKSDVTEINEILLNIRDLNDEIRDNEIFGDNALELRDERNRQIDKLSELIHIKVVYGEENVGAGRKVEKLSIYLDDDNPDKSVHSDESLLVDGVYATQLRYMENLPEENEYYDLTKLNTKDLDPALQQLYSSQYLTNVRYTKTEKDPNGGPDIVRNAYYNADDDEVVYLTDDEKVDYLIDNPDVVLTDIMIGTNNLDDKNLVTKTDENGDPIKNDHYILMLDRLKDELGKEWEKNITEWTEAEGGENGQKAVYKFDLNPSGWKAGTGNADGHTFTLTLNGEAVPFTVGKDISEKDMNDKAALAKFLAGKLNGTEEYSDYTVSANADGAILFTAKKVGAVGGNQGPAAAPAAIPFQSTANGANIGPATIDAPTRQTEGKDRVPPTDPPAGTTFNADGSETIIGYQFNNNQWWKLTTVKQHTYEVTLDDNDLHGSLQATRELLTEKGEFATADDLAIDEDASIKHGIPFYQNYLDLFARTFATEYNKLNQGQAVDQNGKPISGEVTQDVPKYIVDADGTVRELNVDVNDATFPIEDKDYKPNGTKVQNGYLVDDATGNYIGTHGTSCNITIDPIPAGGTVEQIRTALNNCGWFTDEKNPSPVPLGDIDKLSDDEVQAQLEACLAEHGTLLNADEKVPVTSNIPTELGGILFSNRGDGDDTTNITAANIAVSHSWASSKVELVPKFEILWDGTLDHSTQNTNADHMVTLIDPANNVLFDPQTIDPNALSNRLFFGSFNGAYNDMCTTLGEDQKAATVALNMYYTQQVEIDYAREGVSGVDLNDEAMNLMQYQKAYSAACRLMTVIDEALDRLINNTGIAGR